jgi:hypothetical protein
MPSSSISSVSFSAIAALGWPNEPNRATPKSRAERPVLAPDLAGTVAYAGVDPTLQGRALQDALLAAIAHRRGYCWWIVDHAGWVVTLTGTDDPDKLSADTLSAS